MMVPAPTDPALRGCRGSISVTVPSRAGGLVMIRHALTVVHIVMLLAVLLALRAGPAWSQESVASAIPVGEEEVPKPPSEKLVFSWGGGGLVADSEMSGLLIGFRADPGQGRKFGPTFAVQTWLGGLMAGSFIVVGELGVAGRVQGEHGALIPRVGAVPVIASGGVFFDAVVGVGMEMRKAGGDSGLRWDASYFSRLQAVGVGLHFIF